MLRMLCSIWKVSYRSEQNKLKNFFLIIIFCFFRAQKGPEYSIGAGY